MSLNLFKKLKRKLIKHKPEYIHNLWENQIGWGWNVYFSDWENRRLCGHHPERYKWSEGNEVRSKMSSGKIARFKIVEFKPANGVWDMFFCTLSDIGYLEKAASDENT